MSQVYDALVQIAPVDDPETLDGFRNYDAVLSAYLTPQQLQTYANLITRMGTVRVAEDMTTDEVADLSPEEAVVITSIVGDTETTMENRRVVSLLNQQGQHDQAPDLNLQAD